MAVLLGSEPRPILLADRRAAAIRPCDGISWMGFRPMSACHLVSGHPDSALIRFVEILPRAQRSPANRRICHRARRRRGTGPERLGAGRTACPKSLLVAFFQLVCGEKLRPGASRPEGGRRPPRQPRRDPRARDHPPAADSARKNGRGSESAASDFPCLGCFLDSSGQKCHVSICRQSRKCSSCRMQIRRSGKRRHG